MPALQINTIGMRVNAAATASVQARVFLRPRATDDSSDSRVQAQAEATLITLDRFELGGYFVTAGVWWQIQAAESLSTPYSYRVMRVAARQLP